MQAVEDLSAIKSMFTKFRASVRENNGEQAVKYVSKNSIAKYEQFRNWAISAEPAELEALSIVEQIEVKRLQHYFTSDQLRSTSAEQILADLIDGDHLKFPFVENAVLADPVFKGDKCYIQIFDDAGAVKEKLTFVNENDEWKFDLVALEDINEKVYSGMMRQRELNRQELVETIVESWGSSHHSVPSVSPQREEN